MKIHRLSSRDWLVFFDVGMDRCMLPFWDSCCQSAQHPLLEWVLGDDSVLLMMNVEVGEDVVLELMRMREDRSFDLTKAKVHEIGVRFSGPDLAEVARGCRMDVADYVKLFCEVEFYVSFMGFAPGFGYLKGGDGLCGAVRRSVPRERMRAGAVAVASGYACVYPVESPGGWNWLGHSDVKLFEKDAEEMFLFSPMDKVRFQAL